MTAGRRAAERLLRQKGTLADALTDSLYAERPALLEKHGEYGRRRCLEDMHYNLEHLAPAVDLGDPELFAGYVRWLDGLLRARGVSTSDVTRTLELIGEAVTAGFPAEEAEAVLPSLRAGLDVLADTRGGA